MHQTTELPLGTMSNWNNEELEHVFAYTDGTYDEQRPVLAQAAWAVVFIGRTHQGTMLFMGTMEGLVSLHGGQSL